MKFKIGNVEIPNRFILAPMAGVTSKTYRMICKSFGAGLVVGEMVSDKALVYDSKKTFDLLDMDELERPISQQIFGSDPESMGRAAKIIEEVMHPDIIDINMGCPVPKVAIKNHAGSALLKDPEKVRKIVSEVVKSVSVPVTVKIRSGWDENSINAVEIAKICVSAGASAIAIHARTRKDGYTGAADWDIIKKVKESVSIPVIGNGDIKSAYDAKRMIDYTKCDAVMIGRGALGNPWIFKNCIEYIDNNEEISTVSINEKIEMMKYHVNMLSLDKTEKVAILELRTMLMYYLKGMPNTKDVKLKIISATKKDELIDILNDYQNKVVE